MVQGSREGAVLGSSFLPKCKVTVPCFGKHKEDMAISYSS